MSMTVDEAIKRIKEDICHGNPKGLCRDACMYGKGKCAYDMAMRALEEIQQYRAIGTVEELKTLHNDYWKLNEICKEYSAIGTVSEFRELKEKSTAKSPAYQGEHEKCPTCGSFCIGEYCIKCGQRILCD